MFTVPDLLNPEPLRGQLDGASNLPSNRSSLALSASFIVTTGPALLYGFTVMNTNASAQYLQLFDATTVPADGAIPACVLYMNGASSLPIQWLPWRTFNVGIVLCNSSTAATKTIGAADCFFDVQFA